MGHRFSQIKRIYTDFSLIYPWKSVKSVLSVFYSALFRQAPSSRFQSTTTTAEPVRIYRHCKISVIEDQPFSKRQRIRCYGV